MRKLDVSSITDASEMPVKKGTLEFLQDAYTDIVRYVMQSLAGGNDYDPTKVYILYGVVNSGVLPAYNITAGAAFFNGELFQVDAAGFTATGSNVAVFVINQTQYTVDADPVTFTDSAVRNIHNIRGLQIQQGVSGSGISDFSQVRYLDFRIPQQLNLQILGNATLSGVYPNLVVTVKSDAIGTLKMFVGNRAANFSATGKGISAEWLDWAEANGQNGTVDLRGHTPVQITNSDPNDYGYTNPYRNDSDFNSVGKVGGEKVHSLVQAELAAHTHGVGGVGGISTNPNGGGYGTGALTAGYSTEATGSGTPHNNMQPYYVVVYVQKIS